MLNSVNNNLTLKCIITLNLILIKLKTTIQINSLQISPFKADFKPLKLFEYWYIQRTKIVQHAKS